jgi:hypothetical protein
MGAPKFEEHRGFEVKRFLFTLVVFSSFLAAPIQPSSLTLSDHLQMFSIPQHIRRMWRNGSFRFNVAGGDALSSSFSDGVDMTAGPGDNTPEFRLGKIVYVDGVKYACSAAGFSSAIALVGSGGTIHGEGCVSPFTWSATVTITSPVTVFLPCTTVTFTAQIFAVQSDDVHIHGCGSGSSGQVAQYAVSTSRSQFIARGIASTANAIVAKKGVQTTLQAQRLSGFTIDNMLINMNSLGNRGVYTSSCWSCRVDDVIVHDANCGNGPDGAVTQEAVANGNLALTESYFMHMNHVMASIAAGNTTCHPSFFDASGGEVAYGEYTNLFAEGVQAAAGSGSDSVYVNTGASAPNQSFDQSVFTNLKTQDPIANAYGVKLQARGNFASGNNGRIYSLTFIDPQIERIFSSPGTGTGIGCVNDDANPDGTGCGAINIVTLSPGGWAVNEDTANLGSGYESRSDLAAGVQGPLFRRGGLLQGHGPNGNAQFENVSPTLNLSDNDQTLKTTDYVANTTNAGNFNGGRAYLGPTIDMSSGKHIGGRFQTAYGSFCNGFGSWAKSMWCYYQTGPAGNHFDSFLQIGARSAPCPAGAVAEGSSLCFNTTSNTLNLSNNNEPFFPVTQTVGTGSVTTTGTAVGARKCQAQTNISVAGALASDSAIANVGAALPRSWQTGIVLRADVTAASTVTVYLCNPTASSITPAVMAVYVRVLR